MARRTQWTISVRCHHCRQKFTLRHLELDYVFYSPLVTFCPHCCTQLHVGSGPAGRDQSYLRRIDLREENEAVYRKPAGGTVWHFSENCSGWPTGEYLQIEMEPDLGEICGECKVKQLRVKVH